MSLNINETQIIKLFYEAEHYFASALSVRYKDIASIATAYSSDVIDNPSNTLVIRRPTPSLEPVMNEAQAFFAVSNTPYCIVTRTDLVNQKNMAILGKFGFSPHEMSVAMFLILDKRQTINVSECHNMDDRLAEWAIPQRAFPASNNKIPLGYAQSHELALERGHKLIHLSLFANEKPASSLTLSCNNDWARIDDLATVPELQGQGYATKLMDYALNLAANKKARWCFLEASPKGLSLYQKMGFKSLFKNQVFIKKHSS
jgi:GNAT superfamily N-acetyltransferase